MVNRKHSSSHGLSFRNFLNSGVVHTAKIYNSLFGVRTILDKVTRLMTIVARPNDRSLGTRGASLTSL